MGWRPSRWWTEIRTELRADPATVRELHGVTLRRIHTASAIAAPLHLAHLVVFSFLSPTTAAEQRWRVGIMLMHATMLAVMVVVNRLTVADRRFLDDRIARGLPWVLLPFLLGSGAVIAGIDQLVTTSITPYLVVSIVAALVLLLPLERVVLGHVAGFVMFVIAMLALQPDASVRTSNAVNGLTVLAISLLLALLQWRSEVRGTRQARRIARQQEELEARNLELERLATHDGLTGLINRRQLEVVVDEELARMRRYRFPSALLAVDADGFKEVNDRSGHPAGDELLRELAMVLRGRLRASDVIARWGGDEFLVLLPRTDLAGVRVIAEELRSAVAAALAAAADPVTISVGVAELDASAATPLEVAYHDADQALYVAKQQGRNRVATAVLGGGDPVRSG